MTTVHFSTDTRAKTRCVIFVRILIQCRTLQIVPRTLYNIRGILNNLECCAAITSTIFMLLTQCLHGIDIELQILLDLLFGRMVHFWQFYWLAKYHKHRHLQYRP